MSITFCVVMSIIAIMSLGACFYNIIIGEAGLILLFLTMLLAETEKIHPVYCILIGLAAAVMFGVLVYKFYILASLLISAGTSAAVWISSHKKLDTEWSVFLTVLAFLIMFGMHAYAREKLESLFTYNHVQNKPQKRVCIGVEPIYENGKFKGNRTYEYYEGEEPWRDNKRNVDESYRRSFQNEFDEEDTEEKGSNKTVNSEDGFEYLFENCETAEEVKKRYRDLLKIYHPDVKNGSDENTRKIREAYEKVLAGL